MRARRNTVSRHPLANLRMNHFLKRWRKTGSGKAFHVIYNPSPTGQALRGATATRETLKFLPFLSRQINRHRRLPQWIMPSESGIHDPINFSITTLARLRAWLAPLGHGRRGRRGPVDALLRCLQLGNISGKLINALSHHSEIP